MSTRIGHASPRAIAVVVIVLVAAACDATAPSATPGTLATPSPSLGVFADRPGISIDRNWTQLGNQWTFTGSADPQGSPTDVVLDIGPGPETLRQFPTHLPVAKGLTTAGPVTVTTDQVPDIPEICVRFTATNAAGASSSRPLCFPHDFPTAPQADQPTVRIDQVAPGTGGQWTVTAYIDPSNAPTMVVLDVGKGPANSVQYLTHVQVTSAMTLAGSVQVAFTPTEAPTTCIRIDVTNEVGRSSSSDTCFSPAGPS